MSDVPQLKPGHRPPATPPPAPPRSQGRHQAKPPAPFLVTISRAQDRHPRPRPGEIDAFDNAEFAAAVKATGRDQLIIAGISTDVCVAFAALSAVAADYQVHAVLDASGTWNALASQAAAHRMGNAGVVLNSTVAVGAELQEDWRREGGQQLSELYAGHAIPFYSALISYAMRNAQPAGQG